MKIRELRRSNIGKVVIFPTEACSKEQFAPFLGTDPDGGGGEPDHDEPPDGEAECQPDGDRVDHDAEVDMEQQEHRPAQRELIYWKMEFDCYIVTAH